MRLRRPTDQLAGCMWLPRFIDKARHHAAGTLAPGFQRPFCSPLGVDGAFFAHFSLTKDEILAAIQREQTDAAIAAWFLARPASTPERIAAWNDVAPHLGKPGYPGERGFAWALKNIYAGCTDPRVNTAFTAIAWDEGFLDETTPAQNP